MANAHRKNRRRDESEYFPGSQIADRKCEDEEWDTSTLHDGDLETKRPGIVAMKENYAPGRKTKAERKQARSSKLLQEVVTPALMDKIDAALHSESHPSEDTTDGSGASHDSRLSHKIIKDNIGFNPSCFKLASMRQSVHTKKVLKSNGIGKVSSKAPRNEVAMTATLENLDVVPISTPPSKERVALLKQLRGVIRDDLDKVENENRDTMMRMAGYWRYVNRKTFNFMVRNQQIWDWTTGQRLEEIEDEDEGELDMDVADEVLWDDTSTVGTSRSGAATPQKGADDTNPDESGSREERETNLNKTSKTHLPTSGAVDSSTTNPKRTSERAAIPFNPLEPDLRHHEIPVTIAHNEERRPSISHLPIRSKPQSSDNSSGNHAFSPPHHDPNNRYDVLKKSKGGLNQQLGRTTSVKVLKLAPASVSLGETTNSWTTVKRHGLRLGKTSSANALKKQAR
ncbi:MAG: hypothetical protein Q9168_006299 [Polycauliona sp. 1 TL-2023]